MSDLSIYLEECTLKISSIEDLKELDSLRVSIFGKKGFLSSYMQKIATASIDEKKEIGKQTNEVKSKLSSLLENKKETLEEIELNRKLKSEELDISLPVRPKHQGSIHPITQVIEEISAIFAKLGFDTANGPQIEDDFHNFSALNIPENHPARQMQDSFYIKDKVLRTHTSSVQIRYMENNEPPIKIISPGRVYRSDYDITHTPMFHQIEGLYIDKDVNMGHLKWVLESFLKEFFETDKVPTRFRPSFFPFTEPSAEVDIGCSRDAGEVIIGKGNDWLEILGCGMVNQKVLENVGISPEYQGFAFGVGVERLAMLKYGAPDLRSFFDSDLRWLRHFGFQNISYPNLVKDLY